jgi:hypothetical protein
VVDTFSAIVENHHFFSSAMGVGSSTAKASIQEKEDGEKHKDADEDEADSAAPR